MNFKITYLILLLFPFFAMGQSADNSPFSRYGIGNFTGTQKVSSIGMGSLNAVYNDPYNSNFDNPATLTFLKSATYEGGIYAKYRQLEKGSNSASGWSGNLSYLSIAFPLKNQISESLQKTPDKYHYALGLNLAPYTNVNYNIKEERNYPGIDTTINTYIGTGAIYKMVLGSAISYKNFSFGLNIGWIFGKISYSRQLDFKNLSLAYSNVFDDAFSVNGFTWQTGLMYNKDLSMSANKKDIIHPGRALSIGLTAHAAQSFTTNSSSLYTRINNVLQGGSNTIDTLVPQVQDLKGEGKLPAEFGIGIQYQRSNKIKYGVSLNYADWSGYRNDAKPDSNIVSFKTQFKFSAGIEYCPNPDDYKSYYKKIKYRFGVYYQQDPREISNTTLTDYGISFGFGMPIKLPRQQVSFVQWAVELGQFNGADGLKETYARIHFGFTFNDSSWFYKRKFD